LLPLRESVKAQIPTLSGIVIARLALDF